MDITRLSLTAFRNFRAVTEVALAPGALLLAVAPNAVGKTNFLESIVVLLRGHSWRASLRECVAWGQAGWRVEGDLLLSSDEQVRLAVSYQKPGSPPNPTLAKLLVEENNSPASLVTFYSRYPVLVFLPDDTFLLARGPEARRNFVNGVLVSSPVYLASLVRYRRSLQQRNRLLKKVRDRAALEPWTNLLLQSGTVLWQQRQGFVDFINSHLNSLYEQLTGEALKLVVELASSGTPTAWREQLEQAFESEQRVGYTLYGPHRDDVVLRVAGRPAAAVLSRGQVRGVVLALKVAAYRFLKTITQEEPLLLLDDVFSELDEGRQRTLLAALPASQLLITCTAVPITLKQRSNVLALDLRSILQEKTVAEPARVAVRA